MLSIQKRLAINGLFASRFEAISGYSKKNKLIYNKLSLKKNKYDLELGRKALRSPGALGCLLSVRSIIRDAKKRGLKRILLLDDDVIFSKNFLNDFSKASDLPGDWKLLYLGASQHNWSGISKFNDNFYYAKNTSGTFAVGIDHSLFDYILNISSELELPIDSYLERFVQPRHSKSCFVFTENLMIADVTSSDIREPQDQVKRAKRMRWDLSLYDFKEFGLKNIVLCVTTYNRLKYLKDFINSFNETKNTFFKWTLIISDDGSTDQSIEYINSLNLPDVSIVKIFNKRVGVHMQTNLIFDKISKMNYDFAFKADDDIIFKKKGWDSSYIRSSIRSSKKHLVYYNNSWKKSRFIKREPINHIESQASCEDAMGCFWTFNKNVLKRVGNFDTDNFGHRGQGHIDFTARCCRLGFNDSKNVWDSINSNIYISMQPRDGYLSTTDGSEKDALSRSKKEKSRKLTVIRQKRGRVICKI
jgi:GT2 family glycosyltransferase